MWNEVAARLRARLRRQGLSSHDAEEVAQEVAARAVAHQVAFTDADDLLRWASVVGRRIAIDLHRRDRWRSHDEVPDAVDDLDVALLAEHRIALAAALTTLRTMSPRDQEALLSGLDAQPSATRAEQIRRSVARHRARNRLRSLVDGGAAVVAWAWAIRRRFALRPGAVALIGAPIVCVVVTLHLLTGPVLTPPRPAEQQVEADVAAPAAAPRDGSQAPAPDRPHNPAPRPSNADGPGSPAGLRDITVDVRRPDGEHTGAFLRQKAEGEDIASISIDGSLGVRIDRTGGVSVEARDRG